MKKIRILAKKNFLIVLFALFICIGVGVSAYLGLDDPGINNSWTAAITHSPPTPTSTLVPDTGWWTLITTPTPKK